jgi:hypothetical protein
MAATRISRRTLASALLLAGAAPFAWARRSGVPPEVLRELPDARLVGEGTLRFLGIHVYDIRLWAPDSLAMTNTSAAPLALELEYARSLDGKAIAERSIKEMQNLHGIGSPQAERWLLQLQQILPDVKAGDRLTGVQRPGEGSRFFVNGQHSGEVRDAEFTRLFFDIWLSPRTSQPRLREALLGTKGNAT